MQLLQQLQLLIGVLVVVVFVLLFTRRAIGRARGTRVTATGNVFEVIDEVFSPARHSAGIELRTQQEQGPVEPVAGDRLPPTRDGVYVVKRAPAPRDDAS